MDGAQETGREDHGLPVRDVRPALAGGKAEMSVVRIVVGTWVAISLTAAAIAIMWDLSRLLERWVEIWARKQGEKE